MTLSADVHAASSATLPSAGPRWRRHPLLTVSMATVVGTCATGVGAGVGARWASKAGFSLQAVMGLATLMAGLTLLAIAVSIAWRRLRRWARVILIPAGVVVLSVALSVAEASALAIVPPTSLGEATPASYGLMYRDVSFTTEDGAHLSAWYIPSKNGAAVVVRHGSGGTRTSTLSQAVVLARHGFGLLLVDARGHGRSGGTGNDRGWFGDRDTTAAVSFLTDQPGIDASRIGVVGLSMGGEEAIGAAAADSRIRAVVAEGATSRTAADKSRWLPHSVNGAAQRALDRLTDSVLQLLSPAPKPRSLHASVAAATGTSFLLITAGDQPDEARAAADLQAAAPHRVEIWNVPGAGHTQGLDTDPTGWETRVTAFLNTQLAAG